MPANVSLLVLDESYLANILRKCIHLPYLLRDHTATYDIISFYLFGVICLIIIVFGLCGNVFAVSDLRSVLVKMRRQNCNLQLQSTRIQQQRMRSRRRMCAHLRILCLWDILFLLLIFPVTVCAFL